MNKRRLLKLARLLEADAQKRRGIKFNLAVVGSVEKMPPDGKVKLDCGTQACAMGLAALSGAFRRQGLSYRIRRNVFYGINIDTTMNGRSRDYDRAAMAVFDLTKIQAHFLFSPVEYLETPREAKGERFVAKRIRNFVAGKVGA